MISNILNIIVNKDIIIIQTLCKCLPLFPHLRDQPMPVNDWLNKFCFYIPDHGCQSLVCFTRPEPGHHAHVDDHLYLTLILATNDGNKGQCTLRNEIP